MLRQQAINYCGDFDILQAQHQPRILLPQQAPQCQTVTYSHMFTAAQVYHQQSCMHSTQLPQRTVKLGCQQGRLQRRIAQRQQSFRQTCCKAGWSATDSSTKQSAGDIRKQIAARVAGPALGLLTSALIFAGKSAQSTPRSSVLHQCLHTGP